ncbi:hypothetical protein EZV62_009952 [Acer yangbiense]|uniref:Uncharacterized protein n=1 Tax=Acer yangbiense TaxID=1000413 RepID=A0A5C7I1X1_9ROSI|nr:hypothetical protein EZV62_009952 [Acer yangbiense]
METSQSLAVESFSYSWLSNVKPSFDSLDESPRASLDSLHEATSADLDYKTVKSQRLQGESQDFNFDIPISPSPAPFLHADELFSDGLIKPVYVDPSKIETSHTSDPVTVSPVSSFSSRNIIVAHQETQGKVTGLMILTGEFGKLRVGAIHLKHLHNDIQHIQWVIGLILRAQFTKRFFIAKDQ